MRSVIDHILSAQAILVGSRVPASLLSLRPALAKAAQGVYDDWDASNELDGDWQVGFGGICHLIADELLGVLSEAGIKATSVSSNYEVHVYVVAQVPEGVFLVDIPPDVYETGGGYNWKKIEGVEFDPNDVVIRQLSPRPEDIREYVEEWDFEDDEHDVQAASRPVPPVNKFYVAMPFDDEPYAKDKVKDLANGVLDGVQGISDTSEIIMQWYGIARDAVLVMDADKLIKSNKLSRVQYDNPEYLVSNGMAALYRIFDKKLDKSGHYGIAGNLIDYMMLATKPSKNRGNEIIDEVKRLADKIESDASAVRAAIKALPFDDSDDLRSAIRSVTDYQLDDGDIESFLKYRADETVKSLRSLAERPDGLTEKALLWLNGTEMTPNSDHWQAAALAPRTEAKAIDYGWTADQATALVKFMQAYAALVKDFEAIPKLEAAAKAELAAMVGDSQMFYALDRGMRTILEKDFADNGTDDIKTVKGLSKRMHNVFSKSGHWESKDIPLESFERVLRKALLKIGKVYSTEGEWLIKDRKLIVPDGSVLFVTDSSLPPDVEERRKAGTLSRVDSFLHKAKIDKADKLDRLIKENNLERRYKVRRINPAKFDKARTLWHSRPSKKLAAKSFSEKDIPRDFRLMFFMPNDKVPTLGAQLARRELEGVTGITDSGHVLMLRMLGANRNAMLVMPGEQTAKLNKLSRIMYENPEYWMSKDMAALIRVYGGITNREHAINRIFQAASKTPGSKDFMRVVSSLDLFPSAFPATPVNTVKDLAKQWFDVAKPLLLKKLAANSQKPALDPAAWDEWARDRYTPLLDLKNYEKAIRDALRVIAETFAWEGEWLLKDKTLRIPEGARLFITKPKSPYDQARFKEQQAMIAEHGLDKVYKIVWVDGEKLQQYAMKHGMTAADKLVKQRLVASFTNAAWQKNAPSTAPSR